MGTIASAAFFVHFQKIYMKWNFTYYPYVIHLDRLSRNLRSILVRMFKCMTDPQ